MLDVQTDTVLNGRLSEAEQRGIALDSHLFTELDEGVHVVAWGTILDMMDHRVEFLVVFHETRGPSEMGEEGRRLLDGVDGELVVLDRADL